MILTSKNNPLVKETAGLKDKKARKQTGLFLVEGIKMFRECLQSGYTIDRVFVSEEYTGDLPVDDGLLVRVSAEVFRFLSDEKTPQGVLYRVKIPVNKLEKPQNACLVLDGVADPGNMGAIIRTANASGYTQIYLTEGCADPYSPKSVRASMSGIFFTKLYQAPRSEILEILEGVPVIVADMHGVNVFTFTPPENFALVIGNEANGVSTECKNRAEYTVKIPMQSTQESLNASVATGILAYALKKQAFLE